MRRLWQVLTTRGRAFVTAGTVLLLAGLLTGVLDLTRLGVLVVVLPLAAAFVARRHNLALTLTRTARPSRLQPDEPCAVELHLRNGTDRRSPLLMAEELVDFRRELSALVARSPSGQAAAYPVVASTQLDGVCHEVIAPAPDLAPALAGEAQRIALQVAGLLPAMAANSPQASTTATPKPPGTRCSHVWRASYRSLPARDLPMAAPFRMNKGIVSSVMLASSS